MLFTCPINKRKNALQPPFSSLTTYFSRVMVALLVIAFLEGCSGNTIVTSHPNSSPAVNAAAIPSNTGSIFDIGGLHIRADDGIRCPPSELKSVVPGTVTLFPFPDNLVLAANRFTYDSGELAQMARYLEAIYNNANSQSAALPALPETLRWVPGSVQGSDICGETLELTNTSKETVQITSLGVQITAPPQESNYHYRLINACSLLPVAEQAACPPTETPNLGADAIYDFQLGDEKVNTVVYGQNQLPSSLLKPHDTMRAELNFQVHRKSDKLIYAILPEISIESAHGQHTIVLQQLKSTLVFANSKQFTCYGWQNKNFVIAQSDAINHPWCL